MPDPMRPRLVEVDAAATMEALGHFGAVSTAFEAYDAEVYNFLRRSTRDDGAAEDLLQEAFLRLTREVDANRTPEHVRGWLCRVASNLVISRGRRRTTAFAWIGRYGRESVGEDVDSPEAGVLARERTFAIDTVLATLSTEARTALLLSADGFSGEEIATAIGRSHGASRSLLTRTRMRVRREL